MKKIMILMLILILAITACAPKQPVQNEQVVDNGANDVVVEDNAVEDTEYDIVEDENEPVIEDSSLYSNSFEPNYQLLIGSYKIYDDGDLILEFSDDFEVSKVESINVYLSSIGRPAEARHVWDGKYEIIGRLVKPKGKQKYEIPRNTNLIDYKAIVLLDPTTGIVHGSSRLK